MIKLQWNDSEYGFWRASVSVSGGATSDYVVVNYNNARTTVAVYPATRAKAQYSVDSIAKIDAGTAVWIDWPIGAITAPRSDTLIGVCTAIRLVSVIGSASMEVLSI